MKPVITASRVSLLLWVACVCLFQGPVTWASSVPLSGTPLDPYNISSAVAADDWLVLFHAPWCGACKGYAATWNKLEPEIAAQGFRMGVVDGDSEPVLSERFYIKGFPSLFKIIDGHVWGPYKGSRAPADVVEWLATDVAQEAPWPWHQSPFSLIGSLLGFVVLLCYEFQASMLALGFEGMIIPIAGIVLLMAFSAFFALFFLTVSYACWDFVRRCCRRTSTSGGRTRDTRSSDDDVDASKDAPSRGKQRVRRRKKVD